MADREQKMHGGHGQVAVQNADSKTKLIKPKVVQASSGKGGDGGIGRMGLIRKKKEKLQMLLRPRSRVIRNRLPKTIEFGYEFTTTYNRHTTGGGQVKKIFYNKNTRSFVSYNEKQLHVWREDNGEQVLNVNFFDETQSHQISCIVYSSKHMLYLAISTDFKLHIFNELLIRIGWMPLNVRLIYFAYFYEEESTLITGGIDGCFMFKFNAETKYDPRQGVMLDPEGHFFQAHLGPKIKIEKMPLWIKGLKVSVRQNMIFSWSQLKVCFNDLNGKILYRYKKLTSYEDHITDIFVSEKYRYFVSSTYSGQIIVWKLKKRKELIHSFNNSHTKCVTSLQEIPNQPTLFISASNDNTIRIFSLDKFTELYCFVLPAGVTNINLLSEKVFACFYNSQIKIGILHHLALSFYNSKIEVRKIVKMFKSASDRWANKCEAIMTLFSDNSVQIQSSDWQEPAMKSTIFPPPGAKEVMFCGYSMLVDRIILVLLDGTICVYLIDEDGDASILDRIIESKSIKDAHNRNLNQHVTSVTLADTVPPNFDFETFSENTAGDQKKLEQTYEKEMAAHSAEVLDRFLVLGLSKGAVIFLSVKELDRIYARFFFHRSAIVKVVEIPGRQKFITVCAEMNISVWGFKDLRSHVLSLNQMYRPVDELVTMNDSVLMIFKSGEAQLFKYDEDLGDLVFVRTETSFDHDKKVHDVESFPRLNLFITGSLDGYAKVWNVKKELIREIKFPEKVYSVSFLNPDGDILVGHHGKVSMVSHQDYNPFELPKEAHPSEEELELFYKRKAKLADEELYLSLKKRDDDIKKQTMLMRTSLPREQGAGDQQQSQDAEVKMTNMNRKEQRQKSLETERKHAILEERKRALKEQRRGRSKEARGAEGYSRSHSGSEMDDDYTDSDEESSSEGEYEDQIPKQKYIQLPEKVKKEEQAKAESLQAARASNPSTKAAAKNINAVSSSQERVQQATKQQSRASSIPNVLHSQPSKFQGQSIPKRIRHPEKQGPTAAEQKQLRLAQLNQPLHTGTQSGPLKTATLNTAMPASGIKISNSIKDINSLMKAQNRGSSMVSSQMDQQKSSPYGLDKQASSKKDIKIESVFATTAIPKEATDVNYHMAMSKQMHQKHKKSYFTRRDLTLERIQDNIFEHNDPKGLANDFNSILIGQRSQLELSTGAEVTPISSDLKQKGAGQREHPSYIRNQMKNVLSDQRSSASRLLQIPDQYTGIQSATQASKNLKRMGKQLQSHDSILKESGSDEADQQINHTLDSLERDQYQLSVRQEEGMHGSTLNSYQKKSVNSITVKELARKYISDDHMDSLFHTPDASIQHMPPLHHQSNQNTLSQKNIEILEKTKGYKGKRLTAHYSSTSELERLVDFQNLNSSIGPADVLRKNRRYHVQPMHLYAEQMRQYSDLGGAFHQMVQDQKQDSIRDDRRERDRLPRAVGPLEKIKHSTSLLDVGLRKDLAHPLPMLPSADYRSNSIEQTEITVNVESQESAYQAFKKKHYTQRKKQSQAEQEQRKQTKSVLSNQDIEQILRNQDKKVYMNNVPIKSNLVPRRPPVEFQMPSSYQSQGGMQPYQPLEGSVERKNQRQPLQKRKNEESRGELAGLSSRGRTLQGPVAEAYDQSSLHFSGQSSLRLAAGDEDVEQKKQSVARAKAIKARGQRAPNMGNRGASVQDEAFIGDGSLDRQRNAYSQLEAFEEPYYANLKSGLHTANHANPGQDRFSLERLSKNDPLATLDALQRQDYQLVKAQELSLGRKGPQYVTSQPGELLSVKGYSHRPLPKQAEQRGQLPVLVAADQLQAAGRHLNIQESYPMGRADAGNSTDASTRLHAASVFKPSLSTLRATEKQRDQVRKAGLAEKRRMGAELDDRSQGRKPLDGDAAR